LRLASKSTHHRIEYVWIFAIVVGGAENSETCGSEYFALTVWEWADNTATSRRNPAEAPLGLRPALTPR
jgi:hypothetical protein